MTTESKRLDLTKSEQIRKQTIEEQAEHCHDETSDPAHVIAGDRPAAVGVHHQSKGSVFYRVWRFVLHYIEMSLVMCIGGFALNFLFFTGLAQIGYTNLLERNPEFSILMIGILLAVPMAAWMRFRGHDWRSNLEMSSTSIILVILLIGAFWLGIIPKSSMLPWLKALACPVMLIPMTFRLDHYTGNHASHSQHAMPETA